MGRLVALALLLLASVSTPAIARDVDGVQIPDSYSLAGEKQPLVLNGAGYRRKFFIKVYVGALYLAQPLNQADKILNAAAPRVMLLHFVRGVSTSQLATAWREGVVANQTTLAVQRLHDRIDRFNAMMLDLRAGDEMRLELLANGDTRVWINKDLRGTVSGRDFQQALLSAWLGANPADGHLKRALLGARE